MTSKEEKQNKLYIFLIKLDRYIDDKVEYLTGDKSHPPDLNELGQALEDIL